MIKLFTALVVLLLISWATVSQAQPSRGKVAGSVQVEGKSAEAATVMLLLAKDSSVAKLAAADKGGMFAFENIPGGKYIVAATAVGYDKNYSETFIIDGSHPSITLKTINLLPQANAMKTVTVVAKKPFIEQKAGKTVINVEASPTNTGLNALELLEKSPGVSVDNDGNISLKGKQGVLILVDGKPTYLNSAQLAALLKNLQSSSLDQIEIMTNPPAKYDAAGNSGIINIKTKKGIVKGMNGSANLNYSQGYYAQGNTGLNLNYRNNKWNVFGSYNVGNYKGNNRLNIDRNFYQADKVTLGGTADQITDNSYHGVYQNAKAGLDYYFSKKDVAGFVVNGNFGNHHQSSLSNSNIRDAFDNIQYKLHSSGTNKSAYTNISSNFNYKHTFDSSGRELSVDLDYAYYNDKNNSLLNTQSYDANDSKNGGAVLLKGTIPSIIHIYSAKTDYVHPFKSGLKLETGLKSSLVHTDNQVAYLRNSGMDWTTDGRSNYFIYDENINAAYAILSKTIKKWELTGGLRLENTVSKGHQVTNDSTFKRNYTNLFPNAGISYNANAKNVINLSYSRRITRPDYQDLNPFVYFLDSLTYGQGNPYLQPQFTNNFEVSHAYNRFLTTTLNYTQTSGIITELLKQNTEKKTTYQTKENLSSMKQVGLTVMVNKPIKKWWNVNLYTNVYNNHYNGLYNNTPIDIQFTSFMGNMTNSFTFGKGWSAEISGWYRSKAAEGLLIANNMYALNSGLSKQVFKNKGTFKVGIRDIFNSQQFSGYAKYSDVDVKVRSTRYSRQFNMSFIYRFGKKDIPQSPRKTGGAQDEQSRVRSGN